ncbi:DnaA ATPase domain-containing protein [Spiroplasma endosymbiont of Aspidapion aeneum]|uniref:DnaA ATPase domain-containing protein n=1 Tax=Spiroplasma endosymbiont of Aspidapion aeneum TaxID=3066276 RepID=UPI00313E5E89
MKKNSKEIWKELRNWFLDVVDLNIYNEYLKNSKFYKIDDYNYNIIIQNTVFGKNVLDNLLSDIEIKLSLIVGERANIYFVNEDEHNKKIELSKGVRQAFRTQPYSFDTFVEGECNKDVLSISKKIVDNPDNVLFNPLFIYGKSGLGKTHILLAIKSELEKKQKKVYYAQAWEFRNFYTSIAKAGEFEKIEPIFENDYFLIDDFYLIKSNPKTIDLFFLLLLNFLKEGKQVIITGDKHPKEVSWIEQGIKTRFLAGLITNIKDLDKVTAKSILKFKIKYNLLNVEEKLIDFLVENYSSSVRELEGTVNSLVVISIDSKTKNEIITLEKFVSKFETHYDNSNNGDLKSLIQSICQFLNFDFDSIISHVRLKRIVNQRDQVIWITKKISPSSTASDIGGVLGNRDHTTILYSINKINTSLAKDKTLEKSLKNMAKSFINSIKK